jgi:hypothetical protein
MRTSIWYNTEEKLPEQVGHYMTFVGPTLADAGGMGTSYYAGQRSGWRERIAPHSPKAAVVYWCDANPWAWDDQEDPAPTTAMKIAWDHVQEAIRQYEIVKALA